MTPEGRERLVASLDPARWQVCGCPVTEPDGPCDTVLSVKGNDVRTGGGVCEWCRVMHLPRVVKQWRARLEASGFFVRGLTLDEGARLFAVSGIPASAVEHSVYSAPSFACAPESTVMIAKLDGDRWRLSWPGGQWEGPVPRVQQGSRL